MMEQCGIHECVCSTRHFCNLLIGPQDCNCLENCAYCSIVLSLNVQCNDSVAMHITSDQLEIQPHPNEGTEEAGEERVRRSENFGTPVGKSALCLIIDYNIKK